MKVELIDSAGGDLSVVNSARVSFAKEVQLEAEGLFKTDRGYMLWDEKTKTASLVSDDVVRSVLKPKDVGLIRYLAKHRHDTPFRHNFIQLRCKVPLFLARQLMKHQAGLTWNEESRRYIDTVPEIHVPKEWRKRPDGSIKQGSRPSEDGELDIVKNAWYPSLMAMCLDNYERMLELGVAPEQARMVLPQSMMVNFIWSGNLLAFFHVYSLRSGEGAQEEAKEFAELLKQAVQPEFPISWEALENR